MAGKSLNQMLAERKARGRAIPADRIREVGNHTWTVRNDRGRFYTVCTDDAGIATSCNCLDRETHYFVDGFKCKHMFAVEGQSLPAPAPFDIDAASELLWGRR